MGNDSGEEKLSEELIDETWRKVFLRATRRVGRWDVKDGNLQAAPTMLGRWNRRKGNHEVGQSDPRSYLRSRWLLVSSCSRARDCAAGVTARLETKPDRSLYRAALTPAKCSPSGGNSRGQHVFDFIGEDELHFFDDGIG